MNKYFKYFITITKHKYYVMIECFKVGLYWQGIMHDLSKYSFTEFFTSAKYFQGDRTPIGIEKAKNGYSIAWLNHKAKNKHHWEYWIDFEEGKIIKCPIPEKYILEMACDIIGASKAYPQGDFDQKEPYNYLENNKEFFLMREDDKINLKMYLMSYAKWGKLI